LSEGSDSPFIKAADLKGKDLTVTIRRLEMQTVGRGQKAEKKIVAFFDELDKGMVLNATNRNIIKDLYGSAAAGLIGKRITLWPKPDVEFEGKLQLGLRIRPQVPTGATATPPSSSKTTAFQNLVLDLILEKVDGDMMMFEAELFRLAGTKTLADVDDALALEVVSNLKAGK
jgi:hypothetical protein